MTSPDPAASPDSAPDGPPPVDAQVVDGAADAPLPPQQQLVAVMTAFSGPLPPPALLREYDKICPGMAGRLVEQLELQSSHRRKLETDVMAANNRDSMLGIIGGAMVAVACLAVAAYAVHKGHAAVAIAIVTTTLGSLVGVFVTGTRQQKQDLAEKRAQTPKPPPQRSA